MRYLGRGQPKTELKVNFNRGADAMFLELSGQIKRNLVTSEYAQVDVSRERKLAVLLKADQEARLSHSWPASGCYFHDVGNTKYHWLNDQSPLR